MNQLMKRLKNTEARHIHILIIVLGIIFISLSIFHSSLWFDESYSVGIANHSFVDIWKIGGHDVHPVLYYWILHILNLIFGNNILVYRIFSMVCTAILGIIGFTHIRKDFGEKPGILFSLLTFFLPVNLVYAGEIRMYSLAMLLVTLTAIYAYRIYKNNNETDIKNWIIFAICSLASAYTHYYGLMAIGLINLCLMIFFIRKSIKAKKITKNMRAFIISGIIQVILYIPWMIYLLLQMNQVSEGFWIGIKFPDTLIELFTFQFTGNLIETQYINNWIAGVFGLLISIYMIYLYTNKSKNQNIKSQMQPAIMAIKLFVSIALAACIVSLVIWRPIIYARYMLCVTGLFIFFLAYTMAKRGNKYINIAICGLSIIISIYVNIDLIKINYHHSNSEPLDYIASRIEPDDILLYGNEGSGFVIGVNHPNNKTYFWDEQHWNVEPAYKAFGDDFNTIYNLDVLDDYHGRIWIINSSDYAILEKVKDKYDVDVVEQESFSTEYKKFQYTFSLVEK